MTAPALGGESTTLTAPAAPGDRNIQLQSIAGLLVGNQITLERCTGIDTMGAWDR